MDVGGSDLLWKGEDLFELFMNNSVSDHQPRGTTGKLPEKVVNQVLTVQKTETLPQVMRKLATENFMGAPVVFGRRYLGFISMLDLVKKTNSLFWGDTEEKWVDFWAKSDEFESTTVDDIMETPDKWDRDPVPPLQPDFTSFYALEMMAKKGYKRFAITSPEDNKLQGILTQSMLISFLRQTSKHWGTFGQDTLENLEPDFRLKNVECVLETDTAMNAFNQMEDKNIGGLAIIDANGKLTGGISIRDLRGIGMDGSNFYRLFRPVKEFKKDTRKEFPDLVPSTHYSNKRTPLAGLFLTPQDTLANVIKHMDDGNIHRVFICDNRTSMRPIGVISQRDVLQHCLKHISAIAAQRSGLQYLPAPSIAANKRSSTQAELSTSKKGKKRIVQVR